MDAFMFSDDGGATVWKPHRVTSIHPSPAARDGARTLMIRNFLLAASAHFVSLIHTGGCGRS
jgi:hypothetical protein